MFLRIKEKIYQRWRDRNKSENIIDNAWPPSLEAMVEQARVQWQQALAHFETVNEPDLVDLAINNLETAEKRYNYLLRQLREQ